MEQVQVELIGHGEISQLCQIQVELVGQIERTSWIRTQSIYWLCQKCKPESKPKIKMVNLHLSWIIVSDLGWVGGSGQKLLYSYPNLSIVIQWLKDRSISLRTLGPGKILILGISIPIGITKSLTVRHNSRVFSTPTNGKKLWDSNYSDHSSWWYGVNRKQEKKKREGKMERE